MRKIILLVLVLFLIPSVFAIDITREFSNNSVLTGEEVIVNIIVSVSAGDEVYVIEETIPSGINVISAGDGSFSNGKMLWVVMGNIQNITHTYTISSPTTGDYSFNGIYSVNGENETIISGESSLTITGSNQTPTPTPPSNGNGGNGGGGGGGGGDGTPPANDTTPNETTSDLTEDDLQTETPGTNISEEVPIPEKEKSKNIFWRIVLIVIIVIVALVIIIAMIIRNKRIKTSPL